MKDCEQDGFTCNNWPDPVSRRHNSATARPKIYSEEKQNVPMGKRHEMDTAVAQKPGCHQMAFNQSKCQADTDYFIQTDERGLDCLKEPGESSKKFSKRQEKHKNKLELFDTDSNDLPRERVEAYSKSLNGYQKGQRRLYEDEIRLTREIKKKEMLLKEKLEKAAETLRKIQLRSGSGNKVKSVEERNRGNTENRLYYTEKGNWDWESARDRALGGRRHKEQEEEYDDWVRKKDGVEKQEHVKGTNAGQKKKRREGSECENRGRNTQRSTENEEEEYDHFEEMKRNTRERARTEKDKTRRERAVEQQGNDLGEWDQRDLKKREIVRGNDAEMRRPGRANSKRDVCDEDQQWDLMDKLASTSQMKIKAVSKHDKTNVLTEEHLESQGVHQYSNKTTEETPLRKGLSEAGPSDQNEKSLQQVPSIPESSPDTDVRCVPCKSCNRYFQEDCLERHFKICLKTRANNKRKVYNSSYYRAKGTQLEEFLKSEGQEKKKSLE
ncbi:zinc finger C2HC domain-containing protein 1C isoform X2, partial [Clarias magur]